RPASGGDARVPNAARGTWPTRWAGAKVLAHGACDWYFGERASVPSWHPLGDKRANERPVRTEAGTDGNFPLRAHGLGAALAGADADAIVERQDKDLAVADLAGLRRARGVHDGFDGGLDEGVVDADLQLQLGEQADLELGAAIDFGVAALPAAAAHVA